MAPTVARGDCHSARNVSRTKEEHHPSSIGDRGLSAGRPHRRWREHRPAAAGLLTTVSRLAATKTLPRAAATPTPLRSARLTCPSLARSNGAVGYVDDR